MQRGETRHGQLDHAQDPALVETLEQHPADNGRMLARPTS
jgi:hypothetical protein